MQNRSRFSDCDMCSVANMAKLMVLLLFCHQVSTPTSYGHNNAVQTFMCLFFFFSFQLFPFRSRHSKSSAFI
ncbi:hypothetical protein EXN66_Car000379 [Channa argus]|uniref:Uncharacterized protein n=1 Tax=Channa argus TaxID=215402 RepID=A0A6G1QYQ3_CHAAH|nr:hypothetical protein EXN66_Car000379 [Channa argus]